MANYLCDDEEQCDDNSDCADGQVSISADNCCGFIACLDITSCTNENNPNMIFGKTAAKGSTNIVKV